MLNVEESNIVSIFYKGSRKNTLSEMETHTAEMDPDIQAVAYSAIRKLGRMTDREFNRYAFSEWSYEDE